jgi:ER lumen protein retaining receptor
MLQRTGEAETITTHYLFALGIYRALYIPNWIYRYFAESHWVTMTVLAGIVQTVLYADFFWIYYQKCASQSSLIHFSIVDMECFTDSGFHVCRVLKGKKFALPV